MKRVKIPKIGITGGIGAGKTIISQIFVCLGIPVYYADQRAKHLMNHDKRLMDEIKQHFGEKSYIDGKLNRKYLSEYIFQDTENLKLINSLVHPRVKEDYHHWHQQQTQSAYTLKEAALLFESRSYKELDRVILITAPKQVRLERVLLRDTHRDINDILEIINHQMSEQEKKDKANYLIVNDNKNMVIPQVLTVHNEIISLS
jgi:dephospho-CoA kinase